MALTAVMLCGATRIVIPHYFAKDYRHVVCRPQDLAQVTARGSGLRPGNGSSVGITSSLQQQIPSVLKEPLA